VIEIVLTTNLPKTGYRFLCFSDLHLDDYGQDINQPGKYRDRMEILVKIFAYAVENEIADIWCLGDLFHSRTKISIPLIHDFSNFLDAVYENCPGVVLNVILGNHDSYLRDPEMNSLSAFRRGNFKTIDSITYFKNKRIVAVPFGDFSLNSAAECPDVLFFMHTEFLGAENNGYKVMKSDYDPRLFKNGAVLSGHYHKMQFVTDNVMYVGAAIQHNFGEAGNPTVFWDCVLDGNKLYMRNVNCVSPRYVILDVNKMAVEEFGQKHISINREEVLGNYVRLVANKEDYRMAVDIAKKLSGMCRSVEIEIKQPETSHTFNPIVPELVEKKVIDPVVEYLKIKKIDDPEYLAIAKEIIQEVENEGGKL
jgi:DNA repair exonuclease SbcCD nuclease subunit